MVSFSRLGLFVLFLVLSLDCFYSYLDCDVRRTSRCHLCYHTSHYSFQVLRHYSWAEARKYSIGCWVHPHRYFTSCLWGLSALTNFLIILHFIYLTNKLQTYYKRCIHNTYPETRGVATIESGGSWPPYFKIWPPPFWKIKSWAPHFS